MGIKAINALLGKQSSVLLHENDVKTKEEDRF